MAAAAAVAVTGTASTDRLQHHTLATEVPTALVRLHGLRTEAAAAAAAVAAVVAVADEEVTSTVIPTLATMVVGEARHANNGGSQQEGPGSRSSRHDIRTHREGVRVKLGAAQVACSIPDQKAPRVMVLEAAEEGEGEHEGCRSNVAVINFRWGRQCHLNSSSSRR